MELVFTFSREGQANVSVKGYRLKQLPIEDLPIDLLKKVDLTKTAGSRVIELVPGTPLYEWYFNG